VPALGSGKVEADHAAVAPAQRQLGRAHRLQDRQLAHRADDQARGQRAAPQPGQQRLDRGVAVQAGRLEQQRRDAELCQQGALLAGVLGRLEGHALERERVRHRRHREGEALEVLRQAAGVGVGLEPGRERRHVLGRRPDAALPQQFEQRRRTQAAVQMLVQQHLGKGERARGSRDHAEHDARPGAARG
jgi:hypothetical protein